MTNELFKRLVYYPIFDEGDEEKIVAVLEVGYKKAVDLELTAEDTQTYLEQFRTRLSQLKIRLGKFCASLGALVEKRDQK